MRSIIAWKTTPCKHFVKNSGWCPLGDSCNFIHDWQLVYSNMWNRDIIRQTAESSSRPDGSQKATSHCWAHVQGFCGTRNCPHFHPADIQPYIKYTPCPAWLLCDKRDTCPFKHFDGVPTSQVPEQPVAQPAIAAPAPAHAYYPSQPPSVPVAYTPPTHLRPNAVEVCGTTYFPYAQAQNVAMEGEYNYSMPAPVPVPVPVPVPMAAPVPIPLPTQLPTHFPMDIPPPTSPPPSYHYVPQENLFYGEYSTLVPSYVTEPPESQTPRPASEPTSAIPLEDSGSWLAHPDSGSYPESVPGMGILPEVEQPVTDRNSAEAESREAEDQRKKRRSTGHVRRISVNIKTGEVIERTLEGRHGVYGL
ncbi:hypothetical protein AGABI2DRAFT_180406 [Agaricus bisporus var. bisporus H97]|uniref:hypothetical protein n=1 Tax=Agaricus bisporus var. bisporus (strain H97 / ATCC MYA-4626 / FGSC 10389) TaxID=936046 RepID=UPI00029F7257|nr:hypothetical protein AGABI2DRAFT_180406 [Agaricus bisporus var. bisporus H97]EKV43999.1 hypothetical protein AGABI2DRAFT_180406 [Agaricus bisporus var. bisporus H97]